MGTYTITSHAGSGFLLNVQITGMITGRTNVNITTATGSFDQRWSIDSLTSGQQVRSLNNPKYMLNAYRRTWNCDVYTSNADTYINFLPSGSGVYRLQLQSDPTRFLTADGTAAKSNVSWQPATGGNDQLWKLDTVSPWVANSFNFQQVTVNGFTLNIITTRPDNIILKNILRKTLRSTGYYGINGAFFRFKESTSLAVLNIAVNNDVPVGDGGQGSGEDGSINGADDGQDVIIYRQGKLEELNDVANYENIGGTTPVWAQGGASFRLGNSKWYKEWTCGVALDSTSTGRTALVVDTSSNLVYLINTITSSEKSVEDFRAALEAHFGITDTEGGTSIYKGLMLDGGGSTSLVAHNHYGKRVVVDCGRGVTECILLKETT